MHFSAPAEMALLATATFCEKKWMHLFAPSRGGFGSQEPLHD